MNINDIIIEKNISKYKLSKDSGVPYMTISDICNGKTPLEKCNVTTVYRIAKALNTSIEVLINSPNAKSPNVPAHNWAETRRKKYKFPILEDCTGASFDIARIHPLKQRNVLKIHDALKNDSCVESAIIFGSSCGIRCGKGSDIDICIRLKELNPEVSSCGSDSQDTVSVPGLAGTSTEPNLSIQQWTKEINEIKNDISEKIQEACGFDADILWSDHIKPGSFIDNNIKLGVELL